MQCTTSLCNTRVRSTTVVAVCHQDQRWFDLGTKFRAALPPDFAPLRRSGSPPSRFPCQGAGLKGVRGADLDADAGGQGGAGRRRAPQARGGSGRCGRWPHLWVCAPGFCSKVVLQGVRQRAVGTRSPPQMRNPGAADAPLVARAPHGCADAIVGADATACDRPNGHSTDPMRCACSISYTDPMGCAGPMRCTNSMSCAVPMRWVEPAFFADATSCTYFYGLHRPHGPHRCRGLGRTQALHGPHGLHNAMACTDPLACTDLMCVAEPMAGTDPIARADPTTPWCAPTPWCALIPWPAPVPWPGCADPTTSVHIACLCVGAGHGLGARHGSVWAISTPAQAMGSVQVMEQRGP